MTIEIDLSAPIAGKPARCLELRCKPLPGGDGAVAVMRDITSRKWHALAMKQARAEAESEPRQVRLHRYCQP